MIFLVEVSKFFFSEIDFDSINPGMELAAAETLASVEFEEIDLNKIDIIEANKQDTVRVPIRQLRVRFP